MGNFVFNIKKSIRNNINNKKIKTTINLILMLVSFGILFYFCFQNNNLTNLINTLPRLNKIYLQIAFLCIVLSWIIDSKILKLLVLEIENKNYKNILFFKITMVGQYFTVITPLALAAQPMQILEFSKHGMDKSNATALLIRKFYIYQLCLLIYSLLSFILCFKQIESQKLGFLYPLIVTGILFQGSVALVIILFSIKKNLILCTSKFAIKILYNMKIIKDKDKAKTNFKQKINCFLESNKSLSKNKKLNFKIYIYTFLELAFTFLITFFIFKAFNHSDFPILPMAYTQNVTTTVSSFTPLPGSAGTTENVFLILFKPFFYETEIIQAMILFRFISFYFALLPGIIFYKIKIKNFQK